MVVTDIEACTPRTQVTHGVVEVNRLGRVTSFAYKPDRPVSSTIATEVFLYEPDVLVEVLEALHREQSDDQDDGDDGVGDTGWATSATCCCRGSSSEARSTPIGFDGYWRDLGQPHHYLNATSSS
jgi:glucose-1-phosphate adenylyltransferase